jgi:hypothetical protein
MKLAEWQRDIEPDNARAYIQVRLEDLGATEVAALLEPGDSYEPRILIATDLALVDASFTDSRDQDFQLKLVPWDAVPVPWIALTTWIEPRGLQSAYTPTLRIDLAPPFDATYKPKDAPAVIAFYRSVLHLRRGAS